MFLSLMVAKTNAMCERLQCRQLPLIAFASVVDDQCTRVVKILNGGCKHDLRSLSI